jgi:hypothetical protein
MDKLMTIEQLLKELSKHDPKAYVYVLDRDDEVFPVVGVGEAAVLMEWDSGPSVYGISGDDHAPTNAVELCVDTSEPIG